MLTVMTLNINQDFDGYGPWQARRQLIGTTITKAAPDIVLLQAVCRDPAAGVMPDQATQLAELAGIPHVVFRPAQLRDNGREEGQAILSRHAPATVSTYELGRRAASDDPNQRMLLHAALELPQGPLHLFNAYFSWVEEQALDNVRDALPFMNDYGGPAILAGDMNMTPDSRAMNLLAREGWTDAWHELHPDEPGLTFESGQPSKRIDYVWLAGEPAPKVMDIRIIAEDCGPDGARPSDHYGLVATVEPFPASPG
ncbi:MAG TPA: endonuclease/exonuclease/phosphatase family protein, partial [Trueperaceae bacterium]